MENEKSRRLFLTYRTLLRMMLTRGYSLTNVQLFKKISEMVERDMSWVLADDTDYMIFKEREGEFFQQRLNYSTIFTHQTTGEKVFAVFLTAEAGKKVDKDNFSIVNKIIDNNLYADINHLILISENGISPQRQDFIRHDLKQYRIETPLDVFFAYDRTQHGLSPLSVEVILPDKVVAWAKKEKLDHTKLPSIKADDPLVAWYGAPSGSVMHCLILTQRYPTGYMDRLVV